MFSLRNFLFWRKTPIIEFICHPSFEGVIDEPRPAGNFIPNWFKKLDSSIDTSIMQPDHFGLPTKTAKACKPLIDSFNYGFTLTLAGDVRIKSDETCTKIEAINPVQQLPIVEFHFSKQLGGDNSLKQNHGDAIKFINYWNIKTAPGWSTLFIPPVNNFDLPFTCFSGIVDTDRYFREINFPAVWNVPNFDGLLKAGTPLITAIPIKRKTFKQKIITRTMNEEECIEYEKIKKLLQVRSSYYSEYIRVKK